MTDLRYAFRALTRAPWYSMTVIAMLGIGIALNTVAFAIVDGVLFKPLPYHRPGELFFVQGHVNRTPHDPPPVSFRIINGWREAAPALAISGIGAALMEFEREPGREYWSARIDQRFFEVLGTRPLLGGFESEDFEAGGAGETGDIWRPVLVSYAMWQQRFGGDPAIVGRTIVRSETPTRRSGIRIAGVLPRDFVFPVDAGGPQPDVLTPATAAQQQSVVEFQAIARVPRSADRVELLERLRGATRRMAAETPRSDPHRSLHFRGVPLDDVRLVGVAEQLARDERRVFVLVASAAGVLLLLACINAAGLAVARNVERRRQLAVRRALGASAWRLTRAALFEACLLVAAGTAVALLLARSLLTGILTLLPSSITLLKVPEMDVRVFAAMVVVVVTTVLAVVLWPALVAARTGTASCVLAAGATVTVAGRRSRFVLVAAQSALAFVLLTAGGLSIVSFATAWRTDAGFQRDRLILLDGFVKPPARGAEAIQLLTAGKEGIESLDGVSAVAVSSIQPFFARRTIPWTTVMPEGWTRSIERVAGRRVSENYFAVMDMNLVDGRWPVPGEWSAHQNVAIVSQTAARMFWPDRAAVGQRLVPQRPNRANPDRPITVIGVVADTRYQSLDAEPIGDVYLPNPIQEGTNGVYFHVQTAGPPGALVRTAVGVLTSRNLRVEQAATHESAFFAALKHRALPAWLFGMLGLVALAILGAGILGLLAMSTAQRTREIGIRIVVGATTPDLVRLLVREQLGAVIAGLLAGAAVSAWAIRFVESALYNTRPFDPALWVAVAATLVAVAAAGTVIPSLRAARVDPVVALRVE